MKIEKPYSHIESEVEAILPEVMELRREIHRNPELRFEEEETAKLLRNFLSDSAIEYNEPFLGTDVTGLIRMGRNAPPAVFLRADMDALPMEDGSREEVRSRRPGRAHACGHDGHMSALAGAVKVLARLGDAAKVDGAVGFIFQPGEEEGMGASRLLEAGLLRTGLFAGLIEGTGRTEPGGRSRDAEGEDERERIPERGASKGPEGPVVVALHAWPGMPVGSFAARPGPYMAAADRFVLTVAGEGGHGAMPHQAIDPVVAAAELVLALQTIVSRRIDPTDPAVVTVGSIQGGTADNVIPDNVVLKGTIRSFSNRVQRSIREEIDRVAEGICRAAGCSWTISYSDRYPVLSNDPDVVTAVQETVVDSFGTGGWFTHDSPSMGAEDFACYLDFMPGAMIRLGMGEESPSLHAPDFEFKEEALRSAIAFLSAFSVKTLERL